MKYAPEPPNNNRYLTLLIVILATLVASSQCQISGDFFAQDDSEVSIWYPKEQNVAFCKLNLLFAVSGDILSQTKDSVHPLFATCAATNGALIITF